MTDQRATIKVIRAGLGRTGTLSLKAALEELGFSRCYHMTDVFAHREHAKVWDDAAHGQPVDWDTLFQGYIGRPSIGRVAPSTKSSCSGIPTRK
jgi:hypothetical protein